jgi:hypothetical protein
MDIGGSYIECFKGTDLGRTEIACIAWGSQSLVGFAVQGYSTYFFELAGVESRRCVQAYVWLVQRCILRDSMSHGFFRGSLVVARSTYGG